MHWWCDVKQEILCHLALLNFFSIDWPLMSFLRSCHLILHHNAQACFHNAIPCCGWHSMSWNIYKTCWSMTTTACHNFLFLIVYCSLSKNSLCRRRCLMLTSQAQRMIPTSHSTGVSDSGGTLESLQKSVTKTFQQLRGQLYGRHNLCWWLLHVIWQTFTAMTKYLWHDQILAPPCVHAHLFGNARCLSSRSHTARSDI